MKNDILTCHRYFEHPMTVPYKTHAHELWEFLFIVKGNPICLLDGKRYAIKENTLLVFKPAQIHRVYVPGDRPYEYHSMMCDPSLLTRERVDQIADCGGIIQLKDGANINRVLSKIHRQNELANQVTFKNKLLWIEELLQAISEDTDQFSLPVVLSEDPVAMTAVHYIEENVQNITGVNDICDAVGITKENLYHRFIQSMLISPMKYVRAKRAALAKTAAGNAENREELLKRYGFESEADFAREYEDFYRSIP